MKKNIVLIALLTMVYAVNGAEQKAKKKSLNNLYNFL
jgi:hypothetical protein